MIHSIKYYFHIDKPIYSHAINPNQFSFSKDNLMNIRNEFIQILQTDDSNINPNLQILESMT